jgi:hypothetical protein
VGHRVTSLDALGPGVFRKLRRELGITAFGGKDGYVDRDGQMVDPADVERRRAFADGDLDAIRRRA